MKKGPVKKILRWLLAAWTLLAMSGPSWTYVHSHAGGDVSHRHDESSLTISHQPSPSTLHDDHHDAVGATAADIHRHGRLTLLGGMTHDPVPSGPSHSHEGAPTRWETIVTVSAAQGGRTLSKVLTVDSFSPLSLPAVAGGSFGESKQPLPFAAGVAPTSPLCDRARHERSGVLLA
jgi:hypothetical protein